MPDYKLLYTTMFNAAEDAINLLIDAQRRCEELYVSQEDIPPELKLINFHQTNKKDEE